MRNQTTARSINKRVSATRKDQVRPIPAEATAAVTRCVYRRLNDMGFATLVEFKLGGGRRADVVDINSAGTLLMVEVKSTPEDFRSDVKWLEYVPYWGAFSFAVSPHFPCEILPNGCSVIVADAHSAMVMRMAPQHKLHTARRKALTLRFALAAGQRLSGLADSRLYNFRGANRKKAR